MTQEDLAEILESKYHLSLSRATISMYENDNRTPDVYTLTAFTKIFNCTSDYLLGLDEFENHNDRMSETLRELLGLKKL